MLCKFRFLSTCAFGKIVFWNLFLVFPNYGFWCRELSAKYFTSLATALRSESNEWQFVVATFTNEVSCQERNDSGICLNGGSHAMRHNKIADLGLLCSSISGEEL